MKLTLSQRRQLGRELRFLVPAMTVYTLNRLFKSHIDVPVLGYLCRCHLNDFIGGGVFICYTNLILIFSQRQPRYSAVFVVPIALAASLMWEYAAPLLLPYSTSDFLDVAAYVLGALLYMAVMRVSMLSENKSHR